MRIKNLEIMRFIKNKFRPAVDFTTLKNMESEILEVVEDNLQEKLLAE